MYSFVRKISFLFIILFYIPILDYYFHTLYDNPYFLPILSFNQEENWQRSIGIGKNYMLLFRKSNSQIPLEGLKEGEYGKRKGNKTSQLYREDN